MGDKEAADQAAVDGMRYALHSIAMDGIVVIGEGEKDEAPMLYNGERIGDIRHMDEVARLLAVLEDGQGQAAPHPGREDRQRTRLRQDHLLR